LTSLVRVSASQAWGLISFNLQVSAHLAADGAGLPVGQSRPEVFLDALPRMSPEGRQGLRLKGLR
jgi:hypothetical protein